jgi:hypothetical protein
MAAMTISGQVSGEYLSVATRPYEQDGLSLSDASVRAATMLAHDVRTVAAMNLKDFALFEPYVNLAGL